ncbi:MAG: APC family permease, partial [Candidatus Kapaibacterium sp.]
SKVLAMLILILLAFVVPGAGAGTNLATASAVTGGSTLLIFGIAAALQGAFWTYDGWNNVTYIAGEVHSPQKNIPKALIYGLGTIITVYILINLAYAYVLPIDQMATSKLVASDVADRLFNNGGTWIALLVMVSTFGTTNGTILASARVYFSMARRNVFPRFLGNVHERYRTPAASLFTQCFWSMLLVFTGTFNTLIDMLLFVSWIFYAAGAYGLFVLRKKEPDAPRPYRVPLYPIVPALFIFFAVAYLVLTVYNDIDTYIKATEAGEPALINSAMGLVLMFIGTPIYFYYRRRNGKGELSA